MGGNENPKVSTIPIILVNSPTNYTFYGKIAPNYSITITGGPGNYTWYEFLETGENSTVIELSGLLVEDVNDTFDQNLWDNLSNGTVTIRFYANDSLNSVGYSDAIIKLDIIAPDPPTILTAIPSTWTMLNSFNISWSNPSDTSGIVGAYYKLDAAPDNDTDGTYVSGVDIEVIQNITVSTDGSHDIYIWLVDAVGNINYNNYSSTKLYLDSSDPTQPSSLIASPSSWTNINSFNISWSNPSDTSGIAGAYYKLDTAPTNDTDGTYVSGVDIEEIQNITVSTDGSHVIYVWLVDITGNINYTAYNSTHLYLDSSDPLEPGSLIASPGSWTNVDNFTISWLNPSDTSGIAGAYYKLDTAPTNDTDGIYVSGIGIEEIQNITVSTEGTHDIYVWLVDAAGNINFSSYISTQLYLDSSDPSQPSSLIASPGSWTNLDNFTISWSNPSDTSGIVGAFYKLNLAPTFDSDGIYVSGVDVEEILNITVSTEGTHDIYVWLVDAAGNINYSAYISTKLYLDSSDPTQPSSLIANPGSWTNLNNYTISWSNPSDISGIIGAYYKLDFAPTFDIDGTYISGADIEEIQNITVSTEGTHDIYIWLVDAAGNINYSAYVSTQLHLDISDPSTPSLLIANPASWTNKDSFNISWSNPSDLSGIIGAYYKLDASPLSDTDGIYVTGIDIEEILNITVNTEGTHALYVWLVDTAGNVNSSAYSLTQLYLDITAPSSVSPLTADPISWTNNDNFTINWLNPSDTSGIIGAYYKLDIAPTNDTDGIYVSGINIEEISNITVSTEGVHTIFIWVIDAAGNIDYTNSEFTRLYLDISDPSSPSILLANPSSWINIDSFDISWSNPSDTSGIVGAYYKLDAVPLFDTDGAYVPGTDIEEILNITVTTEGTHDIYVWLVDAAGNINYSAYVSTQLHLDISDPYTPSLFLANPVSWTNIDSFNISWSNPFDTSGIVGAYYKLNFAPTFDTDGTYISGADIEEILNITVSAEGTHDIYVWLVDAAGNINYSAYVSTQLYLDVSDPLEPSSLTASPGSWTNLDNFTLSWVNPSDMSGIIGAYYKLDALPLSDTDGTYVSGEDIEEILNITVSTEGTHDIYVWLVDAAGNINYSAYMSIQLHLDVSKPSAPNLLIANPASWTNMDNFNISWSNPSDLSGIMGAYYKLDAVPTFETDGIYVAGTDIEEIINISVSTEGMHDIYVWLVDAAGNINYSAYELTQLYLDTLAPLIIDSQSGDDTWRDTGGTTYNIDFSDSIPSSNLDFAQYIITSEPGQGGELLKNWTNIFTNLGTTDYTTDWAIDFSICHEGINYISVRVYDKVGNKGILNDAFYVKKDTIDPIVIINSPLNHSYWNIAPPINVSVIEPNIASITYTVVGYFPINNWLNNNTEEALDSGIWSSLPQGEFQIVFTSFDVLGHDTTVSLILYKDTNAPTLLINAPTNNTFWNTPPSFNITVFDPNFDSIWYEVNNVNITLLNNTLQQLNLSVWNTIQDEGEFQVRFYANDSFGHINDTFILMLYKDVIIPDLSIEFPFNNTYWKNPPIIKVIVLDTYLHSIWYKVESTEITLSNNTIQIFDTNIWNSLTEEEEFVIHFYANDTTGNLNNLKTLRLYKDIKNPTIVINEPGLNDLYGEYAPDFSISVIEPNLNQTWYTLVGGSFNYSISNFTGKIDQIAWEEFGNGTVTLRFYANDTLGNLGVAEVTLRKNLYAPIINIISPMENGLFGIEAPNFTISKSGLELNTTWYTLDNGLTNYTFVVPSGTISQDAWDLFGYGNVTLRFYINDSLGVIGFDEITVRKDPDPPEITFTLTYPLTNNSYCALEPIFRVFVNEPNLLQIWYRAGGVNVTISNNTEITLNSGIWNSLAQGKFLIEIFATDILGYINDPLNFSFFKDTLAPQLIINAPYNDTYYNSRPPINISVNDPNFNSLTYTVIGYLPSNVWLDNYTEVLLNQDIWDALPQGEFLLSITAYDSFGHVNDTYILTLYKDTLAPVLDVILPEDSSFHNSPPLLKITSDDPNLHTMWYRVNTTSIVLFNNTEQFFDSTLWDSISEGVFTIEFFANDSFGHLSTTINRTLYKDITLPSISILSPNNNTYYSNAPIMNINATDLNLDTVWYIVSGTKIILSGSEPLDTFIWSNLPQGGFQVHIYANDSAGNLNDFNTLMLYKDTLAPIIIINSPLNNSYWNSRPILNVAAIDPNLDSISYKVLGYSSLLLPNNTDTLMNSVIWSDLSDGIVIVEIFAEDSLGNINNSITLILNKDTITPNIIINFPEHYQLFGNNSPSFEIFVNETHLDTTWYNLIGEPQNITFTGFTGTINQTIWDKFGNGTVTIRFFGSDLAGNFGYQDLTIRKNIYAPIITINTPGDDEIFGTTPPNFLIYKSGTGIQETWYTLDDGLTNYTFTGLSGSIDQTEWDNFAFESITIMFYINDSLGKMGYDYVIVRKDPNPPVIQINSPFNLTAFASAPFLNITIIEPNLDKVWYRVGSTTIEMTGNFSQYLDSLVWEYLPQGNFSLELFANDTLGNLNNFLEMTLSKDTIGPNITIILPTENQRVGRNAPFFELILYDENNVNNSWYIIEGSNMSIYFPGSVGKIDQDLWEFIWDNLTRGSTITIRFYSIDKLGNVNFEEVNMIKHIPIAGLISNPVGFIFSSLGIAAMVPITVFLRRSRYYQNLNKRERSKLRKVLISAGLALIFSVLFFI
ncbi:MAG: hypothetical protein ACFFDB_08925 [Promethearchaeota archaeon]